ncbi:MAG TPA: hypothetical protein PLJ35_18225 [Anaerolineae bacterium]|nr:hypothetical protein [Anaerolineae bacterium]HPL29986.1 hypothetical protein [Anaerolineae bacterium]
MSFEERRRQEEKQEEKEEEKHDEKQEEKGREKWQRDPVSAAVWAGILVWAGVVLLAESLGFLGALGPLWGLQAWPIILAGAGLIVILGAAFRLLVPSHRQPVVGAFILGAVLIGVGLGSVTGYNVVGPLILVGLGLVLLLRSFARRR